MLLPEDLPFSPQSIVGILTPLGLLASVGAFIWKAGQWARDRETHKEATDLALITHKAEVKGSLDGFGSRLGGVEREQTEARGRHQTMSQQIDRVLGSHEALIKIIGEARGSTVQCREDTQALGEKIERKMDIATEQSNKNHLDLSTRLAGVERELELMRSDK